LHTGFGAELSEKKLYRVDLRRTSSACIYVLAENMNLATDDALELGHNDCWQEEDTEAYATEVDTTADSVWTGGGDGEWVKLG